MSLINSECCLPLFLDNVTNNLFLSTNLSDSLNDISTETKKEDFPFRQIKFILTKEEAPLISLLQKKTIPKIDLKNYDSNTNGGRWSKDEQKRFAEAVLKFGNDWRKIQNHISTRNITQVRSHAQKFLMKLKENDFIRNKGLDQTMSWTKTMNYLRDLLNQEELKKVLFSVEQNDDKKATKKKSYKTKKKKSDLKENSDCFGFNSSSDTNSHFFFEDELNKYKYDNKKRIIIKEEDEEEILKKFIDCFNQKSEEIVLNTSFEEESSKENEKQYEYLNDI